MRIIWKFLSRSAFAIAIAIECSSSSAACLSVSGGVFVEDSDSDAQVDGGKLQRVLDDLKSPQIPSRYLGTTFQFGVALVVRGQKAQIFRVISNAADDKFESLSAFSDVAMKADCSGRFTLEYEIANYYPNEVAIGKTPRKKSKPLLFPLRAHLEGKVLSDGNLLITACQASELRQSGWRATKDDLGLCNGAISGHFLFNIENQIRGKPGWSGIAN